MEFLRPTNLAEALRAKADNPDAVPIAGGTDVMVELNFDRRRPPALLDLNQVAELSTWDTTDGVLRLGAAVPYATVITELADRVPGLAVASRTVGSPQIRNRGTVGGNLGSASPAGDAHPALLAAHAQVELASVRGSRTVAAREFFTGPKRSVLAADELITAVRLPVATGPQQFAKVGTRNAMVIAVCSFGLALHPDRGAVGTGIGSAGPVPLCATDAETYAADALRDRWDNPEPLPQNVLREFGDLAASAARPIDDVRGTSAYRKHALAVLARRTLAWAWQDYGSGRWQRCA